MEAFMAKPHTVDAYDQTCGPAERDTLPSGVSFATCIPVTSSPHRDNHPDAGCRRPLLTARRCQIIVAFVSGLITLSFFGPAARGASLRSLTINSIDVSADAEQPGNQVRAFVTVSNADDRAIAGLAAQRFTAIEDGQTITIDTVARTADPMAIVLALDTSGSMLARDGSGTTAIVAAKRAAIDFISMLSPEDRIAVFTFDRETTPLVDFSLDHKAVARLIADIRATPKASTRLYDTVIDAVKKASEIPKGRRAVIVLTDGTDEQANGLPRSDHQFSDMIDAATTQTIRVPIYTIGVGPRVDAAELGRMARLTGGHRLLAASFSELKQMYQIIAEQLKNQYRVQYISRAPSGEHSLVIKVRDNGNAAHDEKRFWSPPLLARLAPDVRFVTPQTDDRVRGIVQVQLELRPEDEIAKVRYYVDGQLKNEIRTPPLDRFEWNTNGLTSGLHVLRVEAVTASAQLGVAEITVSSAAPEVEITEPKPAQSLEGKVAVKVRITSDAALSKVRLFIDARLHTERGGPPFDLFQLNTEDLTPGPHALKVSVEDIYRQIGSDDVSVRITQAPDPDPRGKWSIVMVWIVVIVAAAGVYGGIRMIRRRAPIHDLSLKKAKSGLVPSLSPPVMGDEDETVFFPDIGSQASVPMASLTVITSPGLDSGHVFDIQGESKIGRHVQNDIVIADKSVSRKHAEIYFDDNTYYLRDLGSRYGTIVNRRRISLDTSSLFDGAQIQLGPRTLLEFHLKPVDPDDATVNLASADAQDPGESSNPDDKTLKIGS